MSKIIIDPGTTLPTAPITIAFCGDSLTAGAGGMTGRACGWREGFAQRARQLGALYKCAGDQMAGPLGASGTGRSSPLLDYRSCSLSGWVISQIEASVAACEALGTIHAYIFEGGFNDVGAGADAATIIARITTFITNRKTANKNAYVFVLALPPHGTPATHAIRNTVNAAMPAICARFSNCYFIPFGLTMTLGDLADSVHPTTNGWAGWGAAIADYVFAKIPSAANQIPSSIIKRPARAAWAPASKTADYAKYASTIGIEPSTQSFSVGVRFRPSSSTETNTRIWSFGGGGDGAGDATLIYRIGSSSQIYVLLALFGWGGSFVTFTSDTSSTNSPLTVDKWHQLVVSCDASGLIRGWCHKETSTGVPDTRVLFHATTAHAWSFSPAAAGIRICGNLGSFNGAVGLYNDWWYVNGYAAEAYDADRWWYTGIYPQSASGMAAAYALDEGTGTSAAPPGGLAYNAIAAPTLTCTAVWSAAGTVATPWDM